MNIFLKIVFWTFAFHSFTVQANLFDYQELDFKELACEELADTAQKRRYTFDVKECDITLWEDNKFIIKYEFLTRHMQHKIVKRYEYSKGTSVCQFTSNYKWSCLHGHMEEYDYTQGKSDYIEASVDDPKTYTRFRAHGYNLDLLKVLESMGL